MSQAIDNVLVVGGGSAGFLAALTFKRMLPDLQVSLVRSTKVPIIGVGESTTPFVPRHLHDYLGIDRKAFFEEVRPSWKLGVRFEWGSAEQTYFNYPFHDELTEWHPPLYHIDAYYCLPDLREQSLLAAMMDQKGSPILLREGRFQLHPGSAYHLENRAFVAFLEKLTLKLGIDVIDGDVTEPRRSPDGGIEHLVLEDGRQLDADLFIDCSGFRSLLLGGAMEEKYVSYADSLFCDTAVVGSFPREGPILPYTTAETMEHGWCWRIEFEDRVTRGYVYSSNFCSQDEAMREMKEKNPALGDDLRAVRFPCGRYENFWNENVVAIGNASGFVEPLEATALNLILVQLQYLVQGMKDGDRRIVPELREVQNRRYRQIWDDIRDFLAVHYRFNHRCDSAFWTHCREETDLGGAGDLIDLYRAAGPTRRIESLLPDNSIFGYTGYVTLLMGQGVESELTWRPGEEELRAWESVRQGYRTTAASAVPVREALELVRSPRWNWPTTAPGRK
ncbi:MAG: tryptophan 7-halogenase [Phycisphaerae bacterium]|nr:tryptophan 7-halogenase [Phycisphaerae bacterium]